MGYRNREIELKLEILNKLTVPKAAAIVRSTLLPLITDVIVGTRTDEYWAPFKGQRADFGRLRQLDDDQFQMTIKHTDKKDNFNRVELDQLVDSANKGRQIMDHLMARRMGKIRKFYHIFVLGSHDVTVCVYKAFGLPYLIMEIEGRTEKQVLRLKERVLAASNLKVRRVRKSLYRLKFGGKHVR